MSHPQIACGVDGSPCSVAIVAPEAAVIRSEDHADLDWP
jgi:hypothetical protein